jgi:hypothetical protein
VRALVDLKLFNIYVRTSRVRKGYDWLVLPDGSRITVKPGKYMSIVPSGFGFEDLTEEIGEEPDYDFDEPFCVIEEESGFIVKKVKMKCDIGSARTIDLYYGDKLVASGLIGYRGNIPVEFEYTSIPELFGTAAGIGAAVAVAVLVAKKRRFWRF